MLATDGALQFVCTPGTDKAATKELCNCRYSQVDVLLRQALEGISGDAVEPHVISHLAARRGKKDNVSSGLIISQNYVRCGVRKKKRRKKRMIDKSEKQHGST